MTTTKEFNAKNLAEVYGDLSRNLQDISQIFEVSCPTLRKHAKRHLSSDLLERREKHRPGPKKKDGKRVPATPVPGRGRGRPSSFKGAGEGQVCGASPNLRSGMEETPR